MNNQQQEFHYTDDMVVISLTSGGSHAICKKNHSQDKELLLNTKKTKDMDTHKSPSSNIFVDCERLENRDSDGLSASSGASRGSETNAKSRTSAFSLSRLLPGRRRSKSRLSLESEASRSDSGACGGQISPPHSSGNIACSTSSPQPSLGHHPRRKTSGSFGSPASEHHGSNKAQAFSSLEGIPLGRVKHQAEGGALPTHDTMKSGEGEELIECPVCFQEKAKNNFMEISTCHHRCCTKCLQVYFKIEIMESRPTIACPECSELFHPNDIRTIVQDDALMQKYEDFMLRRVLAMDSDTRWCPAPDCGYAVIATGCAGCPKLQCERPGCGTYFCYHCKQHWHPNQTCDAARAERLPGAVRSASLTYSQESSGASGAQGGKDVIKSCPRCSALIVKMDDLSCNHMVCAVCGANFCWLCLKEMSDLHYLSLSGCTFWGRRPWSRKKKILCQLGTLVGAPVGIPLVAGLAVPAIIIGIPIWIGQKIYFRYKLASKHKRNLATTSGVAASLLAAPIIAGLIVGLGVPALLVYVYGVVPVSLCRSQGCGVTTNTSGVRFEFNEQGEGQAHGPYSYAGDNQSIETAPNVANPSIAPSIGDASLGMTNSLSASGSHMERAGVLRDDSDRDSASHRAIAGNSINGSLCSATYSAQHHKLEVQADILELAVHCEKSSMGGESYNVSLNDDASTRALAGSIISPKDKDGVSLCSRHFDGASVAYSEERAEVECDPSVSSTTSASAISANSGKLQRTGSTSCPSSPRLSSRKGSSPAPSTEENASHGGSYRGKKCTRFMDQVSEIEVGHGAGGDSRSLGSGNSNSSNIDPEWERRGSDNIVNTVVGNAANAISELGLANLKRVTNATAGLGPEEDITLKDGQAKRLKLAARASSFDVPSKNSSPLKPSPSSSSTSSLSKPIRQSKTLGDPVTDNSVGTCSCGGSGVGGRCSGVRVKAESTSTLVDGGAETRRSEMGGGGRRKSDSTCWGSDEGSDPRLPHLPHGCCASSERALTLVSGVSGSGRRGLLHRGVSSVSAGGSSVGDKAGNHIHHLSHLSQPSNLWDISELQASMLPRLQHTAGCSDMLAVVAGPEGGASCESVFLDKVGSGVAHRLHHQHCLQHHHHHHHHHSSKSSSCQLMSASSSGSFSSSTEDQSDFIPSTTSLSSISGRRRGGERQFEMYETLQEDDSAIGGGTITSTGVYQEDEGEDWPVTTIASSSTSPSTSSLLRAQSDREVCLGMSASDIHVECPAAVVCTNISSAEEEDKLTQNPKLSLPKLHGFLSRKSVAATADASPESVCLLGPSVSKVANKIDGRAKLKLDIDDSTTSRTKIGSESCSVVEKAAKSSLSYLPDVEMPGQTTVLPKSVASNTEKGCIVEVKIEDPCQKTSQTGLISLVETTATLASPESWGSVELSAGASPTSSPSHSEMMTDKISEASSFSCIASTENAAAAITHDEHVFESGTVHCAGLSRSSQDRSDPAPVLPVEKMVQVYAGPDRAEPVVKPLSQVAAATAVTNCSSRNSAQLKSSDDHPATKVHSL
ncbi:E3 ubiquitin-protein ligase rnf19a-like [Plakobranchus ocellatus]|uniref:RBR-type E3 ubiquitin transferase n=1 Tax=Plakobranchus ocellatus TaxID=259542 RepID=A0AAV4DL30_9GAST|nr:E3 ubiquitin-protein ligase rnf19a-like [Plakobranchus ocellatus]